MAETAPEEQQQQPVPSEQAPDIDNEIQELELEMENMEKETQQVLSEHTTNDEPSNAETDKRSVYVGNVDYHAAPEELQEHFKSCGPINRITIMVDKYTCCPKGFAYMEFVEEESVKNAVLLNDSLFRGRQLKVVAKRTNLPGWNKGKGKGKGKGKMGKPGKGAKGYYDPNAAYYGGWGKPAKGKGKMPYGPY